MSPQLLSRRRFLVTAGAAAGSGSIPDFGKTAPLDIRIAVKFHMIDEPALSVTEKFELLREVGLDGVEFKFDEKVSLPEIEEAREKTGLPVHGIVNAARIPQRVGHGFFSHK